jgi:hypothetical protein
MAVQLHRFDGHGRLGPDAAEQNACQRAESGGDRGGYLDMEGSGPADWVGNVIGVTRRPVAALRIEADPKFPCAIG